MPNLIVESFGGEDPSARVPEGFERPGPGTGGYVCLVCGVSINYLDLAQRHSAWHAKHGDASDGSA